MRRLSRVLIAAWWCVAASHPLLAQGQLRAERVVSTVGSKLGGLGAIADATIGINGRIYIVDPTRPGIVVANKRLRYLRSFGRKGSGPGEFREPIAIGNLADRRLAVLDRALRRITIYRQVPDSLLVFERVVTLGVAAEAMCVLPNGFLIYGAAEGTRIHIFTVNGQLVRSFADEDRRLSPMASMTISQGKVRCDQKTGEVVVTSKFLPDIESFSISEGRRVWTDTLRPFRPLSVKDEGNRVTISGGRGGSSAITSLWTTGVYSVYQTTYEGRVDGATVDTVMSYVHSKLDGRWQSVRVDLPVLYLLSEDLAIGVESDEDVEASLYRIRKPTTSE